jgi:hypothetical protein
VAAVFVLKHLVTAAVAAGVFVFGVVSDVVLAAAIAGFFTLANTALNLWFSRRQRGIARNARESSDALRELAQQRAEESGWERDGG